MSEQRGPEEAAQIEAALATVGDVNLHAQVAATDLRAALEITVTEAVRVEGGQEQRVIVARTEDDLPPCPYNGAFGYVSGVGWFVVSGGRWRDCNNPWDAR